MGLNQCRNEILGANSSYHIQTNASVEKLLFEALVCMVFTRERYCISLVCTIRKAIKKLEVKVDVHERGHMILRKD